MHVDCTTSRPLCEVKRRRARLVLRWGTTWEALVLFLFYMLVLLLCMPVRGTTCPLQDYFCSDSRSARALFHAFSCALSFLLRRIFFSHTSHAFFPTTLPVLRSLRRLSFQTMYMGAALASLFTAGHLCAIAHCNSVTLFASTHLHQKPTKDFL